MSTPDYSPTGRLPAVIPDVETLDELLSRPTPGVIQTLSHLKGDLMVLGASGKMGPSLARMAVRAYEAAGESRRVIGVARFSRPTSRQQLEQWGVTTIACDLLDESALAALPDVPNIVFMAGFKFGASQDPSQTWALNTFLPGLVARRFRDSRIVAFSSGNVYPFVPVTSGGCTECTEPAPVGEYAQSVLGRERIFAYHAQKQQTPTLLLRLNYAVEMRYGVIFDIGQKVWTGQPVDVSNGHLNGIWQGDANALALQALPLADVPAAPLNITGPETASVRQLALRFGEIFGREPVFVGDERPTALLSNAGKAFALFGYPTVPLARVVDWVAAWLESGGPSLGKPTKFEVRNGRF